MPHLMTFFDYKGIGPTNNHAERCLRFAVTWRKRSCGTTSEQDGRFVERILSLRHTCRLQKMRTYPVLVDAMTHFARGTHPTPLCG